MDEKKILSKVKEIKNKCALINIIFIISVLTVCVFLPINFLYKFIIALVIAIVSMIIKSKIKASVADILYDDCDPQTYYAVCHGIYPNGATALCDIQTAYFIGDFKLSARIISSQLQKRMSDFLRLEYLGLLASSAFCAGDFELCADTVKRAKKILQKLKIKDEIKRSFEARFNFFLHFINSDFISALKSLEQCKSINESRQKNTYKLMMRYYTGITFYYSNRPQEAKAEFEFITSIKHKLFVFERAKKYINAIENNSFLPIESISLKEECEKSETYNPKLNKEEKRKAIISAAVLLICVATAAVFISNIPGMEKGSEYKVISSDCDVSEILQTVPLNDRYSLCIFSTPYDEVGVAYLKNYGDDKYSYCVSYVAEPEIYLEQDDGYYINASGNTPKIYFDITDDTALIPKEGKIKKFTFNDREYYFYIFKSEIKYSFFNSCGVN